MARGAYRLPQLQPTRDAAFWRDLSVLTASCMQPQPKRSILQPPPHQAKLLWLHMAAWQHQQDVTVGDCQVMSHHAGFPFALGPRQLRSYRGWGGFLQTFLSVAVLGSFKIYNPKTLCHAHFSYSFKPKCETKSWQYLLWPRLCHLPTPFPFQLLPLCCAVSNVMGCARLVGGIKTQHFIIKKVDRQTA